VPLWRWNQRNDGPDPELCGHNWRIRDVSAALPGSFVCEVCDRCGALRLDGPESVAGQASHVADEAATHLESLARPSPQHAWPPPPVLGRGPFTAQRDGWQPPR
jgi:hypothetical protein